MKIKKALLLTLKILLILAVFVGAIAVSQYKKRGRHEGADKYTTADVTYADGSTAHFDDKNFGTVNKGDLVTLHINLPETAPMPRGTLVFYDYSAVTEVWFGDTLLDSYGEESESVGRMIGNHAFFVDIPDEAWGSEVTIVVRPTENNAFTDFPSLKIFPAKNVDKWFTDNQQISFTITIALLVFAVFGAFACLLGRIRGSTLKNGLTLVLLALLVSLWLISNTMIYNLFRLNYYFWEPLEYMAGFTIAIPVLLFFGNLEDGSVIWKKILHSAAAAILIFFTVATVLNFTNVLHYSSFMNMSVILILASSLLLFVHSVKTRKESSQTKQMLRTGSYIFVLTCLYETLVRSIGQYISIPFIYNLPTLMPLGLLFLLLYMIGAFVSDLYDKQKNLLTIQIENEKLQHELEHNRIRAMINQMHPHFLYNALSSIQIITVRDPKRAYALIRDFTIHLRSSIKSLSSDDPIPFAEELTNVRAYLNIELMRFADKLHVEYDIQCEDFSVVPLTIQPLVENSVKHGIFPKGKDGGTVSIRSYETDTAFAVEVRDDGVGFDPAAAMQEGNNSYGLKNLVFRLKLLLQAEVIIKSEAGTGTLITVLIPKKSEEGGSDENNFS